MGEASKFNCFKDVTPVKIAVQKMSEQKCKTAN